MKVIEPQEAIDRARSQIALHSTVTARVWHIRRLDRPGESYYLVDFGENRSVAVVAVEAAHGEILTWANMPGNTSHQILEAQKAAKAAGIKDAANAELVWQPCPATRSLLYPLWEIRTPNKTVYVDQQGTAWTNLDSSGQVRL